MADVTGTHWHEHAGTRYAFRLTMRGMAQLQAEFGRDIAGILSAKSDEIPDFAAILRIVEVALAKGNPSLDAEKVKALAEDLATPDLVGAIVQAAFPDAGDSAGNGRRAGKTMG
jgi:hypothetical protein